MVYVSIAVGGALGALARYVVDVWVSERTGGAFPFGTLVINISGSFVVGLLAALLMERGVVSPELRPFLMVGFLGAYTTFSTWMLESLRLVEGGEWVGAVANIAGSVLLGVVAVSLGLVVGRRI
ncbi:MAG: fluoride efflux transporter CrcB [Chloroflexi bacterium]|nr:fluoride efflux transporter CrcB [Chloroflexota bacterium]